MCLKKDDAKFTDKTWTCQPDVPLSAKRLAEIAAGVTAEQQAAFDKYKPIQLKLVIEENGAKS